MAIPENLKNGLGRVKRVGLILCVVFTVGVLALAAGVWLYDEVIYKFDRPAYQTTNLDWRGSAPNSRFSSDDLGLSYGESAGLAAPSSKSAVRNESGARVVKTAYAEEGELTAKKIIRNGSLDLFVASPDEAAARIGNLATAGGGFVQNSQVSERTNGSKYGSVTIRVPALKFDEIFKEIKKIAKEVENEVVEAKDVTEQFVDLEAQLRNLKAEEQKYLEFMEQAKNIDETLRVAEKLSQTRGEIERMEGQLKFLSRQVDMSTITVGLTSYDDIKVLGIRWRPLYEVKKAFRQMLEGLKGYVDFMTNLIIYLPVIILWTVTVLVVVFVGWKLLRWIYRRFFKSKLASQ